MSKDSTDFLRRTGFGYRDANRGRPLPAAINVFGSCRNSQTLNQPRVAEFRAVARSSQTRFLTVFDPRRSLIFIVSLLPIRLRFRRLMIGFDVAILTKCKTDKSEYHQDGSGHHQPMWILHPGEHAISPFTFSTSSSRRLSIRHQIVVAAQSVLDIERGASCGVGISSARGQHTQ